jgi:hypothetical protein
MSDVNVIPEPQIMLRKGRDPKISGRQVHCEQGEQPDESKEDADEHQQ